MLMSLLSNPVTNHKNLQNIILEKHNKSSMTQKQVSHSNNLLSIASSGGLIGDVDALLTPIASVPSTRSSNEWSRYEPRPERNLWRNDEIMEMLNTMRHINALELLNDKSLKSETVFKEVELIMNKKGYCKKSHVQIWTKWKFLKSTYTTSRRNNMRPKMITPDIYEILHQMLTSNTYHSVSNPSELNRASVSNSRTDISECENSLTSQNDDSEMVISGVESKLNEQQEQARREEENGLAHPIFGFRLGLVKQEPIDTGYESMVNGITDPEDKRNSTSHLKFRTDIVKQEPMETSFRTNSQRSVNENDYIAINHNPFLMNGEPSEESVSISPDKSNPNTSMPSLRIATFAKEPMGRGYHSSSVLPPHPLRIANVQSGEMMQQPQHNHHHKKPKSHVLKNPQTASAVNIMHISPETPPLKRLTNQTINGGQLRLKHTPLRKTPVSMMPELLPLSAKMPESDFQAYKYSTPVLNKKAHKRALREAKMAEQNAKKRKMQSAFDRNSWNISSSSTRSAEAQRSRQDTFEQIAGGCAYYNDNNNHKNYNSNNNNNNDNNNIANVHNDDDDDDYVDDNELLFSEPIAPEKPTKNYNNNTSNNQNHNNNTSNNQSHNNNSNNNNNNNKTSHLEMKFFSCMLTEFQNSLRDMQREMMSNFFASQMEFARREHEFQIKHDKLKLESFKKQSEDFWKSARVFMETANHNHNDNKNKTKKQKFKQYTLNNNNNNACQTEQISDIKEIINNNNEEKVQKMKSIAVQCDGVENVSLDEQETVPIRVQNQYENGYTDPKVHDNDNVHDVDDDDNDRDNNDNDEVTFVNNEQNLDKEAELNSHAADVYKTCQIMQRALLAE